MKLSSRTIGDQCSNLVILHGLFGSGDNWQTHAKYLSQWFRVTLMDQRNHGHSEHDSAMNYDLMAQDVQETMQYLGIHKAHVLGHSMGGKTAMHLAQKFPEIIDHLMVIDMGVKAYPPHHGPIFNAIHAVDIENCPSRKEAETRIAPFIPDFSTQQFLLKNMYWIAEGKLAWRFNASVLEQSIENILAALPVGTTDHTSLFLTGGKSNYVTPEDHAEIKSHFPQAQFACIAGAGHWVHAEAPQEFLQMILSFLQVVKTD
jgi:pimeloyl-ACP methyl ester carboxylesterase